MMDIFIYDSFWIRLRFSKNSYLRGSDNVRNIGNWSFWELTARIRISGFEHILIFVSKWTKLRSFIRDVLKIFRSKINVKQDTSVHLWSHSLFIGYVFALRHYYWFNFVFTIIYSSIFRLNSQKPHFNLKA